MKIIIGSTPPAKDPASLDGAYLKVDRARAHYEVLQEEVTRFLDTQYERILTEPEEHGKKFWVPNGFDQVPRAFAAIIGDIVHNLRTALDYLVYELARLDNEKVPEPKDTQFPICLWRNQWKEQSKKRLRGISPEHVEVIDSFQPYHFRDQGKDPKLATLAVLHELDIQDKHKLVLPAFARVNLGPLDMSLEDFASNPTSLGPPVSPHDPSDVRDHVRLRLMLGEIHPVPDVLNAPGIVVTGLLDRFAPDFGQLSNNAT